VALGQQSFVQEKEYNNANIKDTLHRLVRRLLRSELEVCAVLVVGQLRNGDLAPEVWGKERVCLRDL
jgi:hypothetical protein